MTTGGRVPLEQRVTRVAEAALADKQYVTSIDVLVGLGWLPARLVDEWRQGRVEHLERVTQANLKKISSAMRLFRRWARSRNLQPSETTYVARTRDRRQLRFSKTGAADIERAYRTHWVSPELSERKQKQLAARVSQPPELVVIWALNDWTCAVCGGTGSLLIMDEPGSLCMPCAGLDHLTFLPSGDARLTRRAKRASRQSAVVVRFSRSRKRYERKGILVEQEAIEQAETQGAREG